jgi:hypothetical protein
MSIRFEAWRGPQIGNLQRERKLCWFCDPFRQFVPDRGAPNSNYSACIAFVDGLTAKSASVRVVGRE